MWQNTWNSLVADPPESRVLIQRRKFPAGIFELGKKGWLYHVCSFWHFWSMQVVLIMTSVPFSLASTSGLSALQIVQNLKSSSNFVKKTMCFGSDLRFEPFSGNLQKNNHVIKTCTTHSFATFKTRENITLWSVCERQYIDNYSTLRQTIKVNIFFNYQYPYTLSIP